MSHAALRASRLCIIVCYYTHTPEAQMAGAPHENKTTDHSEDPGDIPGVSWSRSQLTSVSEYSLCFETSKIASCLRGSPASPAHGNLPSANFENSPSANFGFARGGRGGKRGRRGKTGSSISLLFAAFSGNINISIATTASSRRRSGEGEDGAEE